MTLPWILVPGIIGLLSGGIINYIACILLRSDDPFFHPFDYKDCGHRLSLWEAVPFLSFFRSWKNCRYCRGRLLLQYPLVEVLTASVFLVLAWRFGTDAYALGMMIFAATLIAICITDFKAKIIPHEITYPMILLGIIFSARARSDLLGCLAGIGASYIIFDFLAFYGLKFYLWLNKPTAVPSQQLLSINNTLAVKPGLISSFWLSSAVSKLPSQSKDVEHFAGRLYCKGVPLEELEIIGGGDAVLAALISAWLGWQKLAMALIIGFLTGAILGAVYMLVELWKQRLMKALVVPLAASVLIVSVATIVGLVLLAYGLQKPAISMPYLSVLPVTVCIGLIAGVMIAGSKLIKPFPFGPALAAGAMVAIFT